MTEARVALVRANDLAPSLADDAATIVAGLTAQQKRIAPKYFYDETGSRLFDEICELREYYLTRTEHAIMDRHLDEMAGLIGPGAAVIEFGSGSSKKIRQLLDRLDEPLAYVPVDISEDYLSRMAGALARDYPELPILPVFADFTQPFDLPSFSVSPSRNLVFFPGSTIGNFEREQARSLLEVMRQEAGPGGALLIGVDLTKDPAVIRAAYNDSAGVTAAFNLNVLRRLNAELGANFDLDGFQHEAVYDEREHRIEMRLVSMRAQRVKVADQAIDFRAGEYIITEHSHKYSQEAFERLTTSAGLEPVRAWSDSLGLFSVQYLTVPG